MIKKWHKQLLENNPILWNMRLPGVLLVVFLMHLFHFFVGYVQFSSATASDGYWDNPAQLFFSSSFALFSIIGSFIVFILWLIRVFRNNPFKSFYPVSNGQLFSQFLIILTVSFLNITYYYSYTLGYVQHGANGLNYSNMKRATKLYNNLVGLMNDNKETYALEFRCGGYPYPLRKLVREEKQGLSPDMLKPGDFFYEASDGRRFSATQIDSLTGGVMFSYLNYCNNYPSFAVDPNDVRETYGYNMQESLLKDPKLLRKSMEEFISILNEEHIDHNLTADKWFKEVYNPPFYPVGQLLGHSKTDYTRLPELSKGYYLDRYALERKFRIAQQVRKFEFEPAVICGLLYAALGITLLLFTFRATERRVWVITIIGAALISLIVGAFSALIALSGAAESLFAFYMFVIATFFVIHLLSTRKSWSGASLNWFTLSTPYLSVIILAFFTTGRPDGSDKDLYFWLRDHAVSYFYTFFLVYLMMARFVLVPAYRRWQAMPE